MEEVQKVVCSMSADSAPGPDGFPGSFFQGYHKIKEDLFQLVTYFFAEGTIPRSINATFL